MLRATLSQAIIPSLWPPITINTSCHSLCPHWPLGLRCSSCLDSVLQEPLKNPSVERGCYYVPCPSAFHRCDKVPEKINLIERKTYWGLELQRLPSTVAWPRCCGIILRQEHRGREHWAEQSCSPLVAGEGGGRPGQDGVSKDLLSASGSHLLQFPLPPSSPFS